MCIFYESDMAQMIMRAAAEEELPCFFLNEKDETIYKLVKHECGDEEALYNEYRRKIARKISISRNQEIYIYKTKCSCGKCYSQYGFDNLELYKAIVSTVKNEEVMVAINLFHCRRCGKFFAEEKEICDIEKKYGLLSIRKKI